MYRYHYHNYCLFCISIVINVTIFCVRPVDYHVSSYHYMYRYIALIGRRTDKNEYKLLCLHKTNAKRARSECNTICP